MITWFSRKNKEATSTSKKSDDFVSIASHELRSPLSVIKWYTEILLDGDIGPLTDEQRKYLTVIESSNERAIDLVRSLLNVSRLDLGTFCILPEDNVSLEEILDRAISQLKEVVDKKKVHFVKEIDSIPRIALDKHLTLMVIKNLLANAVAFSRESGIITLRISLCKKGEVVEGKRVAHDSILLSVLDQGIGIPQKDLGFIFSKMFKGSNVHDEHETGSGLGLYIAKSIIEYVHGSIWFTSLENKGTQFYVTFPLGGMIAKGGKTTLD